MVMTMGLLGREKKKNIIYLGVIHVLGSTLGGAIVGGLLGVIGWLSSLFLWRTELIAIVMVFAFWQSITQRPARLGIQKQVPRIWAFTMLPEYCYFLWGILLGSGLATVVPYSSFFILLTTQLSSGFALGCATGALFGAMRQLVALLPFACKQYRVHPEEAGMLKLKLTKLFSVFNILLIVGSGYLLLLTVHSFPWRF